MFQLFWSWPISTPSRLDLKNDSGYMPIRSTDAAFGIKGDRRPDTIPDLLTLITHFYVSANPEIEILVPCTEE
jgi:hypothetical protein